MVETSDDPPMRPTIAPFPHESCEQSVQGDHSLYASRSLITKVTQTVRRRQDLATHND